MIILLFSFPVLISYSLAEPIKAAIITFDDGMLSQYTYAKPILDKYNFMATFYIICNNVDKENRMNWNNIQTLEEEGHEIGSHSMNHKKLSKLSEEEMIYEIIESKRCLQGNGLKVISFSFPYNDGDNNKNILKIIADNYYIARTASEPLMLFECRGEQEESFMDFDDRYKNQCHHYSDKNNENKYFKKYTITGLSHEAYKNSGKYSDGEMYEQFIDIVESQTKYNTENTIGAIPILIYHSVDYSNDDYSINPDLFEKEVEYLFENGYKIFQMKDIVYDEEGLHIKGY
ncbi:MAG TPA: polysaccharide deacetylase family protein [Nitrososphaeraceae archaeon]|nr:polysaccharide deacetylase family protein [Nitrososphaeraceae archaeon]